MGGVVGLGLAGGKMILRILISAVFLVAGLLKLWDPLAFADGIAAFRVFPEWTITPLALGVPYFEILTALGILGRRTRSAGALAACGLAMGFAALYASAFIRGLDVQCSCFGTWKILQVTTQAGLLRALVLLVACLSVYGREIRKVRAD